MADRPRAIARQAGRTSLPIPTASERPHKVTVQTQGETSGADGEAQIGYSNATPQYWWVRITPTGGSEEVYVGKRRMTVRNFEVEGLYRSDITERSRLLWGSRELYVTDAVNDGGLNGSLLLSCTERT